MTLAVSCDLGACDDSYTADQLAAVDDLISTMDLMTADV